MSEEQAGDRLVSDQLVSVIVPAYNAAEWIEETLASIAAQTHRALDVIVVDDGSTDCTAAIAERVAHQDPRFRVIRQVNAGVAEARNCGAALARSDLLAFADADDLWAPQKIERQIAALKAAGPDVGLCYSWYAMIDAAGKVFYREPFETITGDVLDALFLYNFIGNGSSALVRRQAFDDAGGFEPALRNAGAQGCEDILFYCRVAERHRFTVVPEYDVGYRQLTDNMSSDLTRMLRSWLMVVHEMEERHPDKRALLNAGLHRYARWLTRRAVHRRQPRALLAMLATLARRDVWLALRMALAEAPRPVLERLRPNRQHGGQAAAAAPFLPARAHDAYKP